jgi:universal stress protein E
LPHAEESGVKQPKSILVVVDRRGDVTALMRKALMLARPFGARLELFLCDSEQAYVLGHAYDRAGIDAARAASVAEARRYLSGLRDLAATASVDIAIDAECESPLYESVVRKALRSAPDMVIKDIPTRDARKRGVSDPNDWQLMRTCPATLMLSGRRAWRNPPRFAAAVDVSEGETAELSRSVVEAADVLARGFAAELHVVYGETGSASQLSTHRGKLRGLCDAAGIAAEHTHILSGQPERTLPAFLREQGYDALVLGALAHRSAGTTPVGTLTSTLLDALDCDFVLVKSSSYRSPIDGTSP